MPGAKKDKKPMLVLLGSWKIVVALAAMMLVQLSRAFVRQSQARTSTRRCSVMTTRPLSTFNDPTTGDSTTSKGRLLVLGGTGFVGQAICKRALIEGYDVTSLSRRGLPPTTFTDASSDHTKPGPTITATVSSQVDYRQGDATKKDSFYNIMQENNDIVGVIHCIGLLFDDASGLGSYNRFVSGSGSLPDADSTYDAITKLTAFHAIDAATEYAQRRNMVLPFGFISCAEAGWPDVTGGPQIERIMPDFLKRYLAAKRAVEARLLLPASSSLRPIIARPSLIYSLDRFTSLPPVAAFAVANFVGVPFVDRPVTVQSLSAAMVRAMSGNSAGVLRYPQIDELSA